MNCKNCNELLDPKGDRHFDGNYYCINNRTYAEPQGENTFTPKSPWCLDGEHSKCKDLTCECGCHRVVAQNLSTPEPAPFKTEGKAIWDLVINDMRERDEVGEARYGTRLQAHNGRDALIDAYQEALDLVVYLRQMIEERESK